MTQKRHIPENATPAQLEAFWEKVDKSRSADACWQWQGSRATSGRYGTFYADGARYRAHRWIYAQMFGLKDQQNDVDHTCHNADETCTSWDNCEHHGCVNPAHLEEVPHEVNTLRGRSPLAVHARKTHCTQGHEYSEENTWVEKTGSRHCRECHRTRVREAERRKRAIAA